MITKESTEQGDILAISGLVEDIQEALLNYQVGNGKAYPTVLPLKLGHGYRWWCNRQYMIRVVN